MLFADVTRLIRRHVGGIRHTGIDRVSLEYARWAHERGGCLCVKRFKGVARLSRDTWARLLLGEKQPGQGLGRRGWLALRALSPRKQLPQGSTILVTTHSWLGHGAAWNWLTKRKCKVVVFVHDLIPIQFPEYSHPNEKARHARRMRMVLRHARGVIVNSSCTESALRSYAEHTGQTPPPILVAPLGHDFLPKNNSPVSFGIHEPYFVVLGTIEPRKNHLLLLTLWRELVKRHGANTPGLVVIGRRGWECEQVVDMLERCEAIHPYLIEKNDASDDEVVSLLTGARALLMPSYAEGFGMPVQEALALGTPVISTPLPAIKEFAGEIPDYAEPHDGARWLNLIEDYAMPHSTRREAQLQRLPNFRHHTWQEHFERVEEFLGRAEL